MKKNVLLALFLLGGMLLLAGNASAVGVRPPRPIPPMTPPTPLPEPIVSAD